MTTPRVTAPFRGPALAAAWLVLVFAACADSPTQSRTSGALEPGAIERWTTGTPESQALDPVVLGDTEARIDAGDFGLISSLLVVRNGVLVFERYWGGWNSDDLHAVNSVTKSVTALAVGVAVSEALLPDLDASVLSLLPGYDDIDDAAAKEAITLRHVLQMRTGFEWDELSTNYSAAGNPVRALAGSPEWIDYVLNLPLATDPGTNFTYNSGVSMLMSAVLEEVTGSSAEEYAAARLFAPLGIDDWFWESGPGGLSNSGWGLHLRPRDMMRIGEMVLGDGEWEDESVVPEVWLDASAAASTRFVDGTGYGFQWWLGAEDDAGSRPVAAWGYGGQFIVAIPSLDLVVVSTAENFDGGGFSPYSLADILYRAAGVTVP